MKAYVHKGESYMFDQIEQPRVRENQVLVKMKSVGLNRRDLMIKNKRGKHPEPLVLGSDGSGIVEAVGDDVTRFKKGDAVMVNPGMGWLENSITSPDTLQIVGLPDHGTFSEYYCVDSDYLELKPDHLSFEEASVFSLAGLTAYRAMFTKGELKKDETVFIPGAGSGVATYLIQFAKALGARVIVTSRSEDKCSKAEKIGADLCIDTNTDWKEVLKNETVDLVIDSVGEATFNRSLAVLKKGGRLVTFGATTDDVVSFNVRTFFYQQQQILGSTLGSVEELKEMIEFVNVHQIHPVIDQVFSFDEMDQAFNYLDQGKQFGKIAVKF
ncbi:zinc-binding alcohol dehydrogenase/oxidoreductase [Pelagirhabdus alkalitolerans]|uniref:Zinc-binding alcohol dehydrogenase/oxidoreductase n=1 Tax=Pelagirhabdus alkalitolerans TaxID=1612202 RepID=A0A1G6GY03_9BACI|nr:zinc-binding dehydrogenase [Pelagirhabdus alkalitolerans]SDB86902.1 zinc-binding alcohol dehydrogenase/oxidoreductase [Pelagirhabdus alkalitolerans]